MALAGRPGAGVCGTFRTSPTREGKQVGLVQGEALLTCREGNHVQDRCRHVAGAEGEPGESRIEAQATPPAVIIGAVMSFQDTGRLSKPASGPRRPSCAGGSLSHSRERFRPPSAPFHPRGELRSRSPHIEYSDLSSPHINPPSHLRGPNP